MTSSKHLQLGAWGENIACRHLQKLGYILLYRNWRSKKLEIDIIAYHNGLIVIIEVKTRSNNNYGEPISSISKNKEENLRSGALRFLESQELEMELRFDVISIVGNKDQHRLSHIEQAF